MNIIDLLKKKWIFKKNSKINVLSVDDNYAKLKLKNASFKVFNTNEINYYYLFKVLFTYFFQFKKNLDLKSTYLKIIIGSYNPDIIIGHEFCVRIFKIKKLFPNLTTIVYQHTIYFRYRGEINKTVEVRLKNTECDFLLIYNDAAKEVFKNVKTKFIIAGSVKANARPKVSREKKYDIMYISEFRKIDKLNLDQVGLYDIKDPLKRGELGYLSVWDKNFGNICSSYVLSVLNEYSLINKKKFCIGRASSRADKVGKISMTDENYFHRIFAPNHLTEDVDTETLAEKSNLIICLTSNLGAELMLKGHKVFFLNINSFANEWPFKENLINAPFWYKGNDKKEIFDKVNQMLSLADDEWKKILSNHFDLIKYYDSENSILNSLVEKIIYNKN